MITRRVQSAYDQIVAEFAMYTSLEMEILLIDSGFAIEELSDSTSGTRHWLHFLVKSITIKDST